MPIYQTSTYAQSEVGVHKGFDYSRTANPTRAALEACLASLDGGRYGLAFASGMAAEDTLLHLFETGDHVVACDDVYGGTFRLFHRVLERVGLRFTFVDATRIENVEAAIEERTRLIWLESPTNPLLKLIDIAAVSRAGARSATSSSPSTTRSPARTASGRWSSGADVVHYSTTKYLGGHSDVVGGALVTPDDDLYERLKFLQNAVGGVPGAVRQLAGAARAEDAGGAHAPALGQRAADRLFSRAAPAGQARVLPGPGQPPAARAGQAPDGRRLRRHAVVRGPGRRARPRARSPDARACSPWPRAWAASRA